MNKLIFGLLTVILCGCASVPPVQLYEGEKKSVNETSTLSIFNFCPYKLNGKELELGCENKAGAQYYFEVEPGEYEIEFIYNSSAVSASVIADVASNVAFSGKTFSQKFTAEAGYQYHFTPDLWGLTTKCEGVDLTVRER